MDKLIATQVTLNIGLESESLGSIATKTALNTLEFYGLYPKYSRVQVAEHEFGTERTLIAVIDYLGNPDSMVDTLYEVSKALGQDCIAYAYVRNGGLIGGLCGPDAEKWGTFNPQYFIPFDSGMVVEA